MWRPSAFCFAHFIVIAGFASGSWQVFFRVQRILLLSVIILLPSTTLQASESKLRLIDSSGGQAQHLSSETVREIFFMRLSSWPDGSSIHVFVLPDNHPLHSRFAKEILGVYPFQLRSAWDRLVYSGTGVAPTTVESVEEMVKRVESTPGGVGYTGE